MGGVIMSGATTFVLLPIIPTCTCQLVPAKKSSQTESLFSDFEEIQRTLTLWAILRASICFAG